MSAIGFSQNTALPAAAAATTRSAWNRAGAAITTASISGSANTSAGSVYARLGTERRGQPLRRARRRVGDRDQPGAGNPPGQRLAVERAHPSRPDQGHPDRPCRPSAPPQSVRTFYAIAQACGTVIGYVKTLCLERSRIAAATVGRDPQCAGRIGRRPTLADVAARAGVSVALVSIVMRDVPGRQRGSPGSGSCRRRTSWATAPTPGPGCCAAAAAACSAWCSGSSTPSTAISSAGSTRAADRLGYELALSAVTPDRDEQRAVGEPAAGPLRGADPARPARAHGLRWPTLADRLPVVVVARAVRHRAVDVVRTADDEGLHQAVDHLVAPRPPAHRARRRRPGPRRRGPAPRLPRRDAPARPRRRDPHPARRAHRGRRRRGRPGPARRPASRPRSPRSTTAARPACSTSLRRAGLHRARRHQRGRLRRQPARPPLPRRPDHRRPGRRADQHARRRPARSTGSSRRRSPGGSWSSPRTSWSAAPPHRPVPVRMSSTRPARRRRRARLRRCAHLTAGQPRHRPGAYERRGLRAR